MHATELSAQPRADREAMPRLAVLIPVYNGQIGFERSLASLAHDGERFDVVAVDDGSEPPITAPPDLPFSLTLLRCEQNGGITRALNAGLKRILADGYTYVARLRAMPLSRRLLFASSGLVAVRLSRSCGALAQSFCPAGSRCASANDRPAGEGQRDEMRRISALTRSEGSRNGVDHLADHGAGLARLNG
jgi:Glycosyl transferase family 2